MQYGIRQRSRKRVPKRYAATCDHGNYARGLAEIYGQGSYATGHQLMPQKPGWLMNYEVNRKESNG